MANDIDEIIRSHVEGDTKRLVREAPADIATVLTGYTINFRIRRVDGVTVTKTITTVLNADGQIDAPTATPPAFFILLASTDIQEGTSTVEEEYIDGNAEALTNGCIFIVAKAQLG